MSVVNEDHHWYKQEKQEGFNNFDYDIDNDQLDTKNISKIVNTS